MYWLLLALIGVVLLVIAYRVPMPPPMPIILQVVGWVMVVVGLALFLLGLFGVGVAYATPALL